MKIVINSYELLKALKTVKQVVSDKSNINILKCVIFDVKNGLLTLKGSDQETYLTYEMSLDSSSGSGIYAIEPKFLFNFIQTLENQPITIEFADSIVITTDQGTYNLQFETNSVNEIPSIPLITDAIKSVISSDSLLVGLNKTIYAASIDNLRPQMCGVFMEFDDNVNFVSTTSYILAQYNSDFKEKAKTSFVLPIKAANLIKGLLSEHCNVSIEVGKNKSNNVALFKINDYRVYVNVISGESFPNYKTVIPSHDNYAILDRTDLLGVIRRVSVFSNQQSKLLKFTFKSDSLKVEAQDIDFSLNGMERLSCEYEGEGLTIGFKSDLLVDALNSIATVKVKIELGKEQQACLIKPVMSEVRESVLVMPMMIS